MRHSKRVPISRFAEKSGVFLDKKSLLESEKRHFQVLAHLWREESKLRNALEGLNSESSLSVQIHYTIADLYNLVSGGESLEEDHTATPTAGLLRRLLAEHSRDRELLGDS